MQPQIPLLVREGPENTTVGDKVIITLKTQRHETTQLIDEKRLAVIRLCHWSPLSMKQKRYRSKAPCYG
jgi:uracil DNA glycosylase